MLHKYPNTRAVVLDMPRKNIHCSKQLVLFGFTCYQAAEATGKFQFVHVFLI